MKKMFRIIAGLAAIGLSAALLNGCTFIVKTENYTRYYGIDEKRGSQDLKRILDKQQEIYQAEKSRAKLKK